LIYPYFSLKISDQGKGIPDDLKQKVFEPFVSFGEEKGTGLGLTIVFEAIQNFNGRVWIENNDPIGTTVCLELPIFSK
jgi:signal transduction histidine kinase